MFRFYWSSITLLLVPWLVLAAPSSPTECIPQIGCDTGFYCETNSFLCKPCLSCQDMKRETPSTEVTCVTSMLDCGPCLEGLNEDRITSECISGEPGLPATTTAVIVGALVFIFVAICVAIAYNLKNLPHLRIFSSATTVQSLCGNVGSEARVPPPPYSAVSTEQPAEESALLRNPTYLHNPEVEQSNDKPINECTPECQPENQESRSNARNNSHVVPAADIGFKSNTGGNREARVRQTQHNRYNGGLREAIESQSARMFQRPQVELSNETPNECIPQSLPEDRELRNNSRHNSNEIPTDERTTEALPENQESTYLARSNADVSLRPATDLEPLKPRYKQQDTNNNRRRNEYEEGSSIPEGASSFFNANSAPISINVVQNFASIQKNDVTI